MCCTTKIKYLIGIATAGGYAGYTWIHLWTGIVDHFGKWNQEIENKTENHSGVDIESVSNGKVQWN